MRLEERGGGVDPGCRLLLRLAGFLVPRDRREVWRKEWLAELWYYGQSAPPGVRARLDLVRRCLGSFSDAWCLACEEQEWATRVRDRAAGPAFCLLAIVAVIAGIGLASGWFAGTRRMATGLPLPNPAEIVTLTQSGRFVGIWRGFPPAKLAAFNARATHFSGIAAFSWQTGELQAGTDTLGVRHARVTANFFSVLETGAASGRTFQPGDETNCVTCVVLSHQLWRDRFASDPAVVGRKIILDGLSRSVIGVLDADFWFLHDDTGVWSLRSWAEQSFDGQPPLLGSVGRLPGSVDTAAARAELEAIGRTVIPVRRWAEIEIIRLENRLRRPLLIHSALLGLAVIAIVAWTLLLGRRRRSTEQAQGHIHTAHLVRYRAFFAVKSAGLCAAVVLAALEFTGVASLTLTGASGISGEPLSVWLCLVGFAVMLYLARRDQAVRCRVCLRRLVLPVRMGSLGSVVFDRAGMEMVCPKGHGALLLGEATASLNDPESWIELDESWREISSITARS